MTDPNDSPDKVDEHPVADPLTQDTTMSGLDESVESDGLTQDAAMSGHDEGITPGTLTHDTAMSDHDEGTASDGMALDGLTQDAAMSGHDEGIAPGTLTHDATMSGHDEGVELDGLPQDSHLSVEVHGDASDSLHEHNHEFESHDDSFQRDHDLDAYDPNTEGENLRNEIVDDQNISKHSKHHEDVLPSVEEDSDVLSGAQPGANDSGILEQSRQASHHGSHEHEQGQKGLKEDASIQQYREPSSLFVPEEGDPEPPLTRPSNTTTNMPPPVGSLSIRPHASIESPGLSTAPQSAASFRSSVTPSRSSMIPFRPSMTPSRSSRSLVSLVQAAHKRFSRRNTSSDNATQQTRGDPTTSARELAEIQDDIADKKATEDFERRKKQYDDLKRKNDGKLSFKNELEWYKISTEEETRREKRKRDRLHDQEENEELFPVIGYEARTSREPEKDTGNAFEFSGSSSQKRRRTSPSEGPYKPLSMQEAEYESMMVAVNAEEDMPGKRRGTRGNPLIGFPSDQDDSLTDLTPSQSSSSKRKKARKPRAKKTTRQTDANGRRLTAKEKRAAATARTQLNSLLGANVFEQQASEDAAEQPSFVSGVKADALKEIIAGFSNTDKKSRHDVHALKAATMDFNGRGSVKADKGLWKVKGMETSLKPYQLLGAAWMRRKENGVQEPRGGLLADQMGLGKTLMMLANIVNGRPPKTDSGPKTTLLVASPALLDQWASEIEKHTSCDLAVMRYSAGKRVDSNRAGNIIDGHDIILTTWDEVRKSYPKYDPPEDCQSLEKKVAWWKKQHDEHRGQLHRIEFLRIVLDEAQAIKNHRSQTSIACRGLIGRHKWALSGTPILNGVFELYPYFKFIGVPHTGDFEDFESNYCDVAVGVDRLLIRLSQFMLRRTHSDTMFGAPILKLPRADQSTYWCDFNPVERLVYDIVWKRFWQKAGMEVAASEFETGSQGPGRGKKNRKLKTNSAGKPRKGRSYNCIFVLLLRLRQLCSHILMLQFVMRDLLEPEDIVKIAKVVSTEAANRDSSSGRTIVAIRRQLDDLSKQETGKANHSSISISSDEEDSEDDRNRMEDVTEGESGDGTIPDLASQMTVERQRSGRDFGKKFDFNPFLKSLESGPEQKQKKKEALCSWCNKPPTTPWSMSCSHLICAECLEQANEEAAEGGFCSTACNICGEFPTFVQEVEDEEDDSPDAVSSGTRSRKKKKKSKKSSSQDGEEFPKEWLDSIDDDLLPSAKTIAMKAQIMNWIKENKNVKIIVFTQFLPMIQIMARICYRERWGVEEYTGKMSFAARQKALKEFAEKDDVRVLLASLRCGGLGLNLTMAQKVILVDPWWNSGSEQQAFCRVFRIGQNKKTYLSRMCVRQTIDQRIVEMQKEKQEEIDEVMEAKGEKTFTHKDLLRLFGNVGDDADGRPFIYPSTPGTEDGLVHME